MSLRDRLGAFVLTKQEQRTVAFVVILIVLGLLTKYYRAQERTAALPNASPQSVAAPSSP